MKTHQFVNDSPVSEGNANWRRKGCFRFSLQKMFIGLTLTGSLWAVLWSYWWVPWQAQKQSVDQIRSRLGDSAVDMGACRYELTDEFPWWKNTMASWLGRDSVTRVTTAYSERSSRPIDISAWKGLKSVESVSFEGAIIKDLAVLEDFKNLKDFHLSSSPLLSKPGATGLEVLGKCKQLEKVTLCCNVTDDLLDSICNATKIRCFQFESHGPADLSPLKKLEHLEELKIFMSAKNGAAKDFMVLGSLLSLKVLELRVLDVGFNDYSFLKKLTKLERCTLFADLTDQQQKNIRQSVPAKCEVSFN